MCGHWDGLWGADRAAGSIIQLLTTPGVQLLTKPHGHGDVHFLMHSSGTAKRWLESGIRWIMFFQAPRLHPCSPLTARQSPPKPQTPSSPPFTFTFNTTSLSPHLELHLYVTTNLSLLATSHTCLSVGHEHALLLHIHSLAWCERLASTRL